MVKYTKNKKETENKKFIRSDVSIFDVSASIEEIKTIKGPLGTIQQCSYIVYGEMSKGDC